jgi:hypothetical protein
MSHKQGNAAFLPLSTHPVHEMQTRSRTRHLALQEGSRRVDLLQDLPLEILYEIFDLLTYDDWLNLDSVCRSVRGRITSLLSFPSFLRDRTFLVCCHGCWVGAKSSQASWKQGMQRLRIRNLPIQELPHLSGFRDLRCLHLKLTWCCYQKAAAVICHLPPSISILVVSYVMSSIARDVGDCHAAMSKAGMKPGDPLYKTSGLNVSKVLPNLSSLEIMDPCRFFHPRSYAQLSALTHLKMSSMKKDCIVECPPSLRTLNLLTSSLNVAQSMFSLRGLTNLTSLGFNDCCEMCRIPACQSETLSHLSSLRHLVIGHFSGATSLLHPLPPRIESIDLQMAGSDPLPREDVSVLSGYFRSLTESHSRLRRVCIHGEVRLLETDGAVASVRSWEFYLKKDGVHMPAPPWRCPTLAA